MTFIAHPFLCSVCKKPRENDANHWFVVYVEKIPYYASNGARFGVVVEKWDAEVARLPGKEHACGQECMQTLVERWAVKGVLT